MDYRTLELNMTSAKELRDANSKKMAVYAIVSLSGKQKIRTFVDRNGGSKPTWNFPVKFTLEVVLCWMWTSHCRSGRGNRQGPRPAPAKKDFQMGLRTGFVGVLFAEIISVLGVDNVWLMSVGKFVFCVLILVVLFSME